jgi:hypothetical protein
MEQKGTEKPIDISGIKTNVHGCFSIFSLICLIIFYRTEWNGMEKLIDIFGIKTMFTAVSESLA